ncbi:MAG TPA: CsgG/HfaB family protein [Syntrophorhabdaceae bacterium]|nr:CsgG/HfaB family protein [Syntrophorhabdaceae bacterium]
MKKFYGVLVCFALVFIMCTNSYGYEKEMNDLASYIASNMDKIGRKRVAIVDFNDQYGKPMELGKYISDELSLFLRRQAKGFEVLERAQLKTILSQNRITIGDPYDPAVVKKLGQIARVGAIVTGSIRVFHDTIRVEINIINTYLANVIGSTKADIIKTQRIREFLEKKGELVGHWRFNDPNNLGFDSSGYGNHGSVMYSKVRFVSDGMTGGAAYFFEGRQDAPAGIIVRNSDSLNIKTGEFTIAVWVKPDGNNIDNGDAVVSKCCEPYALFTWLDSPVNGITAVISSGAVYSGYVIPNNVWSHIAVTYDGNVVRFYHNGSLVVNKPFARGLTTDNGGLYIGASPHGAPEDFSGMIDEVRIYNKALSDAEINNIYNAR